MFTALNRIGLLFGILGAVILFVWGPPQPSFSDSTSIDVVPNTRLADGRTAGEHAQEARRMRSQHEAISKLGLAILAIGFGMQFVATFGTH